MPNGVVAHNAKGKFDVKKLLAMAKAWGGLEGLDLAKDVSLTQRMDWDEKEWDWTTGYTTAVGGTYKVVAIDYGLKRNILRCLTSVGCDVTVVPANALASDILAMNPDGIFLSNGPGDPAATGEYAVPEIQKLIASGKPIFGICLGHQMLGLALGAKTKKMHQGHHGANHPVQDFTTGKVEITSMNHGFTVDRDTLPQGVTETHVSLFDGSNAGLALTATPSSPCNTIPKPPPARRTATTCSQGSWAKWKKLKVNSRSCHPRRKPGPRRCNKRPVSAFNLLKIGGAQTMSHLEPEEPETKLPTDKARAGVTGHNVRYVLAFGLAGIIVAFAALLFIYN